MANKNRENYYKSAGIVTEEEKALFEAICTVLNYKAEKELKEKEEKLGRPLEKKEIPNYKTENMHKAANVCRMLKLVYEKDNFNAIKNAKEHAELETKKTPENRRTRQLNVLLKAFKEMIDVYNQSNCRNITYEKTDSPLVYSYDVEEHNKNLEAVTTMRSALKLDKNTPLHGRYYDMLKTSFITLANIYYKQRLEKEKEKMAQKSAKRVSKNTKNKDKENIKKKSYNKIAKQALVVCKDVINISLSDFNELKSSNDIESALKALDKMSDGIVKDAMKDIIEDKINNKKEPREINTVNKDNIEK